MSSEDVLAFFFWGGAMYTESLSDRYSYESLEF